DALALFGRQLLPHLEALHDALATLGGQALEALVRLLQLLAARLGQLVPALQILKDALLLLRWQRLELLEVLARAMPLLRSELLPLAIALEDVLPLLGRHLLPALEVALRDGALLGREAVHALDRRRLAEGDLQHAAREQRVALGGGVVAALVAHGASSLRSAVTARCRCTRTVGSATFSTSAISAVESCSCACRITAVRCCGESRCTASQSRAIVCASLTWSPGSGPGAGWRSTSGASASRPSSRATSRVHQRPRRLWSRQRLTRIR